MRRIGMAIVGFAGALGLAFGLGHAVQWLRGEEAPVVCPHESLTDRLDGHIVGLAHVLIERFGGQLAGMVPGAHPAGPDAIERLTIVQGDAMYRTRRFDRKVFPGGTGYQLTIPVSSLRSTTPVMFVTSACVPDHPVKLRHWSLRPYAELPPASHGEEAALRAYMRGVLPADEHPLVGRTRPRIVGALATDLPGCARPAVVRDTEPHELHPYSALVCLGAGDEVLQTLHGPERMGGVLELAALDIDGDGHDELIAVHAFRAAAGNHVGRAVLIHREAGDDSLAVIELGPTGP